MLAPDSFTLPSPLESEDFPPPSPPKYLKHQVYTDPSVFIQVDSHAIKVSQCQHPTFRDLMWDLVYRYELSELERARVIFRWMTSKDMSKMGFVDVAPGSAEEVLMSFHQKRGTLAHIFELMCRFSGIPSATISGFAKGVDYLPGDEFRGRPANHSWNVVYLMGAWQLIDAHWATRYLVTSEQSDGSGDDGSGARIVGSDIEQQNAHVVYEYDDFYFIMEPQQAVYSHFPDDSAWQLVSKPLTLEQFELLPLCKSQFFRCGMDFLNQHRGVVSSRNGQVQMALAFHKPGCSFTYKLQYAMPHQGSANKAALELRERVRRPQEGIDVDLRRFLLLETLDNEMHFYCRLPLKGVYYLTVYAQEASAPSDTQSAVGTFRAACEYKLLSDAHNSHLSAYPACHDANWGPSRHHMQHYGLTSQWREGVVELESGDWQSVAPDGSRVVDVHFSKEQPRAQNVRLYARIRRRDEPGQGPTSEEDEEKDVLEVRESTQESIVHVRLPHPGEFGVEIYANDPKLGDGDSYTHVCQYLVHWPSPPGTFQPAQPPALKGATGPAKGGMAPSRDHREDPMSRGGRDHISPLRGMYDYAQEAPSVGTLPQPYTKAADKPGRESPNSSASSNSPGEKPRVKLQYSPSGKVPGSGTAAGGAARPAQTRGNVYPQYGGSGKPTQPGTKVEDLPPPPSDFNASWKTPQGQQPLGGGQGGRPVSATGTTGRYGRPQTQNEPATGNIAPPGGRPVAGGPTSRYMPEQGVVLMRPAPGAATTQDKRTPSNLEKPEESSFIGEPPKSRTESDLAEDLLQHQPYLKNLLDRKGPKQATTKSATLGGSGGPGGDTGSKPQMPGRVVWGAESAPQQQQQRSGSPNSGYLRSSSPGGQGTLPRSGSPAGAYRSASPATGPASSLGRSSSPYRPVDFSKPQPPVDSTSTTPGSWKKPPDASTSVNVSRKRESSSSSSSSDGDRHEGREQLDPTSGYSPYQKVAGGLASGGKHRGGTGTDSQRSEVTIPVIHVPASHNFARAPDQYAPSDATGQYGGARPPQRGASGLPDSQESRVTQGNYGGPEATLMNYHPEKSSANWRAGPIQREPPKEFAPQPVRETESKPQPKNLPDEVPTVVVPAESTTFKVFNQVDKHAVEISQETQSDFNQLIWQLIYARNITDDLEKVRVIFLWLCTKDLHAMSFLGVQPGSPEEILMGIRTGRSTYAQIFQTLCQYAGVQCKLISGYAKGADYEPGQHFTGQECRHSWNAVLIHGTWQLIDCHWAARRLIGHPGQRGAAGGGGAQQSATHRLESIRYELDMFYFLCKPNQLIYTHFPYDADWQLLRHPVSLQEFEALAPVKSNFFKYQLELRSHRMAVIECQEEVMIKIGVPQSLMNELAFTFSMCRADNASEDFKGVPLSRYGKQEMMSDDSSSTFYIRPPQNTSYKLLIYAKQLTPTEGETSTTSSQVMYGAVCEYRLEARFPANFALPPFPPCTNSSYGAFQPTLSRYGVQPHCSIASLRASQGYVELVFYLPTPASNAPPPRLMAKLKSSETQLTEEALRRCLLLRNVPRKDNKEAVLSVFLPRAGEYGLEIYANEPARDGNSFFQIYQYFIVTESASNMARNLPMLPPGFLGGQEPMCSQLGVAPVNYPDPYIASSSGELVVQMAQTRGPLRLMCQLWFQPGPNQDQQTSTAPQDCSHQVLQQVRDRNVYFIIRFPRAGYFKLQVFAAPSDSSPTESLPCVFNYLLDAGQPSRSPGSFPQQFAHWRENGYLHEPVEGELFRLGQPKKLKFAVEVPQVQGVAVVVGEDWTHLHRQAPSWRWEGDVELAQHWGRENCLTLCASYEDASGSYNTLLTYRLA